MNLVQFSATSTFGQANIAGDMLVAIIGAQPAVTAVHDSAGNTYTQAYLYSGTPVSGYDISVWVCYSCVAHASGNVVSLTGGTSNQTVVYEVKPDFAATFGSAVGVQANSTVSNPSIGPLAVPANSFVLLGGFPGSIAGLVPSTGWTIEVGGAFGDQSAWMISVAGGSTSVQITSAGRNPNALVLVALTETYAPTQTPPAQGTIVLGSGFKDQLGAAQPNLSDANAWTRWDNPDSTGIDYVYCDAGVAVNPTSVKFSARATREAGTVGAKLQASNDATWATGVVTLWQVSAAPTCGTLLNGFSMAAYSGYTWRYYRWLVPNGQTTGLADLEFYGYYASGVNGQCAPVAITNFNGTTGGFYDAPVRVRMSCPTTTATIRYTTDGTNPQSSGTAQTYTGPIVISTNTTIQACATLTGLAASRVTAASYYINVISVGQGAADIQHEVTRGGYRWFAMGIQLMFNPPDGLWYAYGQNNDMVGFNTEGNAGVNVYSSPDLRNWSFVANVMRPAATWTAPNNFPNRTAVLYCAANGTYVAWQQTAYTPYTMYVWTATSPGGPFTLNGGATGYEGSRPTIDGFTPGGDIKTWLDGSTGKAYLIFNAGGSMEICQLTPDFVNSAGSPNYVQYEIMGGSNPGGPNPFSNTPEGYSMFKIGSTYYWMASMPQSVLPGLNQCVEGSSPLGPWSAPYNPLQPDSGSTGSGGNSGYSPNIYSPSNQYGFDGQNGGLWVIPGRTNGYIWLAERYDAASSTWPNASDTTAHYHLLILPIKLDASNHLKITWLPQWSFDTEMPQGTGQPAAPSALTLGGTPTSVSLTWVNNATQGYALYLDRAADSGFSVNLVSEVLNAGQTSFTDTIPGTTYYYRVRAVNASGSSISNVVSTVPPAAATYYVNATAGNDSANGLTPGTAWASLAKVNAHSFVPGDTILFNGGQTFAGGLALSTSGTSGLPISFGSYGTGVATIQSPVGTIGFYAHNCGYIALSNLNFTGPGIATANEHGVYFLVDQAATIYNYIRLDHVNVTGYQNGIFLNGNSAWHTSPQNGYNDVRITNCNVYANQLNGIMFTDGNVTGAYSNVYVGYCNTYNNPGIPSGSPGGWSGTGVNFNVVNGGTLEYCSLYGNGTNGGNFGVILGGCNNVTVQFCEAYNNTSVTGNDGGGFDIDGECTNCTIQYCYSHGNYGAGFALFQWDTANPFNNNVIRYNISENDGFGLGLWGENASFPITNSSVYNNVFYSNKGPGVNNFGYSVGITVQNNIFFATNNQLLNQTSASTTGVTYDHNDYYAAPGTPWKISWGGTTYTTLASWGQDAHGLTSDPLLVNPGNGGTIGDPTKLSMLSAYLLLAASPMIDAGVAIANHGARDFYGNPLSTGSNDIGANEFTVIPIAIPPIAVVPPAAQVLAPPGRARIYHPFKRVWTPRTPDSSYDSFAGLTPPFPIVQLSPNILGETQTDPKTGAQVPVFIGLGVTIANAVYLANIVVTQPLDRLGVGVTIHSGTYTHP